MFYNIDSFVGPPGAPAITQHFASSNREGDVMLVQFCFKKIAENPQLFSTLFRPPKKFPIMKVVGKYGRFTGVDGWDKWWKASDVPSLLRSMIQDPANYF